MTTLSEIPFTAKQLRTDFIPLKVLPYQHIVPWNINETTKIVKEYGTQINLLAEKAAEVKKPVGIWAEIYRQHLHNK